MGDEYRQKSTHQLVEFCFFLSLIFTSKTAEESFSPNPDKELELTTQKANEPNATAGKAKTVTVEQTAGGPEVSKSNKTKKAKEAAGKATTEAQTSGVLEVSKSNKTKKAKEAAGKATTEAQTTGVLEVSKYNKTKKAKEAAGNTTTEAQTTGGLEAPKPNSTIESGGLQSTTPNATIEAAAKLAEIEAEEAKAAENPKTEAQTAGPSEYVTAESEAQIAVWSTTVAADSGSTVGIIVAVVTVVAIIAVGCCAFFLIKKSKKGEEEDKGKDKIKAAKGEQEKLLPEKKDIATDKQLVSKQNEGYFIPMVGLQANPIAGQQVPTQNQGYVIPPAPAAAGNPLAVQPVIPPAVANPTAVQPVPTANNEKLNRTGENKPMVTT